ncbi:hypothetical protein H5410_052987 [Solanum commersonii]|uniref:Uncharacterized protein n=1 Tax=Solanum commersonii TaxID=4109 RepID=A0A9J5X5S5_SOLCO|nr:hypothetical protein H5410_052987 [Solanum commersonii]
MESVYFDAKNNQFSMSNDPRSTLTPYFIDFRNFDIIFAKIFHGRSLRPLLMTQLALMAKTAHFKGQTNSRASKPPILSIFVCYSSPSLLTFVNILAMELVGTDGQNGPFSKSNEPRSRILMSFDPNFLMDIR